MSFAAAASGYLSFNFLLLASWLTLLLIQFLAGHQLSARQTIRLHYALLGFLLAVSAVLLVLPTKNYFPPLAKVWAPPKSYLESYLAKPADRPRLTVLQSTAPIDSATVSQGLSLFLLGVLSLGLVKLCFSLRSLQTLKASAYCIRRIGQTAIYSSPEICVPLSYWLPGQANVLLPAQVSGGPRLAIAHELQHHRQGDTKWLFVVWSLKQFCFLNPAIYFWSYWLQEIQEFACDEALVDQGKVDLQAYTRCLFETALTAFDGKGRPVGATALIFTDERHLLTRRIEKMHQKKKSAGRGWFMGLSGIAVTLVAATAFASRGLVQDRRIGFGQAREMLKRATVAGGFPIVVNDRVLKWLNYDLGTPEGRQAMRQALERLETFRPMIEAKLQAYGVPAEIMAIPIVESGFQNLPEAHQHGAGLWMFVASTARHFNLRVDATIDERLNPTLETDAAMRYLQANHLRFSDWQLAIMAYNAGEGRIQEGIDKTGSRDPWGLVQAGYEGDSDYLAKVMAAILVMKNPGSVN